MAEDHALPCQMHGTGQWRPPDAPIGFPLAHLNQPGHSLQRPAEFMAQDGWRPFDAPVGCPCTPELLCGAPDLKHFFSETCAIPRHGERTYSIHGGAGRGAALEQVSRLPSWWRWFPHHPLLFFLRRQQIWIACPVLLVPSPPTPLSFEPAASLASQLETKVRAAVPVCCQLGALACILLWGHLIYSIRNCAGMDTGPQIMAAC